MKQLVRLVAGVTGLLALRQGEVRAQTAQWPLTRLDSVATVGMPYSGNVDETFADKGLLVYHTSTSDNEFDAAVFIIKKNKPAPAGRMWVPNPKICLPLLMALPSKSFSRAKLKSTFPTSLPSAPQGQAVHQVYSGFDEYHQSLATMELTYVTVGSALYVFRCSTQLPEESGATEDMKHFFTTITFKLPPSQAGKE